LCTVDNDSHHFKTFIMYIPIISVLKSKHFISNISKVIG
jgi:hypothetical protein